MRVKLVAILFSICGALLISCSKITSSTSPQGTDFGSGGNAYAAEFKDIGRMVVQRLKVKEIKEVGDVSVASFEEVLEKVEVKTTEAALKIGDTTVDAINYADQMKVDLSLVHWASSFNFFDKRRLVIHETLGLMKKDDADYERTTEILRVIGPTEILFNGFTIYGEVAKTLIEKMPWKKEEVDKNGDATWYTIPFDAEWNQHEIKCMKVDRPSGRLRTDIHCSVKKYALLGEDGVIYVSLADVDGDHALWRLFYGPKLKKFDYGVIKGDFEKLLYKLEFYL